MENSHLGQLLQSLGPVELKAFERFLQSPYFNLRNDVRQLFQALRPALDKRQPLPGREVLFRMVFPEKQPTPAEARMLVNYLTKLFEQFLQIEQIDLDPGLSDWLYVKGLHRLGLEKQGSKAVRTAFERLEKSPFRNAAYHEYGYRLLFEETRQRREQPEESARRLKDLNRRLHTTMVAMWLRQACLSLTEKAVYNMETDLYFMPEIFRWVEQEQQDTIPAVGVYYYGCKMLITGEERWFQRLKHMVLKHAADFPSEELHDLHLMSINYCVRQLNAGNERYFQEVHELYKAGLETKTLFNNGVLSPFTYINIAISGLKVQALDWVAWFIPQYKNSLERRFRDSAYSFNMARLHYARRDYGEALLLLQKANYRDLLTNLAAKAMALKIYYEQGEYEVLQSHLEAMTHFLRRKRVIGYHRENYLNMIRATKKLLAARQGKGEVRAQLRQFVETTDPLTERAWFLSVLSNLP